MSSPEILKDLPSEEITAKARGRLGDGWEFYWRPNKQEWIGAPDHWATWKNSAGYSIGEIGYCEYMACGPDGEGLKDETGHYLERRSPEEIGAYIDALLSQCP